MFTDRMDDNYKESLYEYGIIRNPDTNKVIYCTNIHEKYDCFDDIKWIPEIKTTFINISDVTEALNEAPEGYFSFIGSDKETEISNLNNRRLTYYISTLNQYNGYFELY